MTTHTAPVLRRVDPAALIPGDPFVALRVGPVYAANGEELPGNITDRAQLLEMVAYFERVQAPSGEFPLLDFDHGAVGPLTALSHPERSLPLGAVVAMRVVDDGLEVTPAWTRRGREIVDAAEGLLYPSAAYRLGDTHDRATGERVSSAALLAVAVTPTPATRPDQLGAVRSQIQPDHGLQRAAGAADEEVPMGIEELLAALQALTPEDKAKLMAALQPQGGEEERAAEATAAPAEVPPPAEPEAEAAARSTLADLMAWRRRVEGERAEAATVQAFGDLVRRGAAAPSEEALYRAARAAGGEALLAFTGRPDGFARRAGIIGEAAKVEAGAPPSDRRGFGEFVARNIKAGESPFDALCRIRKAYPAQSQAAFGDRGHIDDSPLEVIR